MCIRDRHTTYLDRQNNVDAPQRPSVTSLGASHPPRLFEQSPPLTIPTLRSTPHLGCYGRNWLSFRHCIVPGRNAYGVSVLIADRARTSPTHPDGITQHCRHIAVYEWPAQPWTRGSKDIRARGGSGRTFRGNLTIERVFWKKVIICPHPTCRLPAAPGWYPSVGWVVYDLSLIHI